MKKLILLAFIGFSQFITAQVTKNLGDFSTVRVFDRINVTLVKSTENKIVITGSDADKVEIVTKNNDLKIRMQIGKLLDGDNVEATLYYKTINQVEASEGSYVGSSDTFKSTAFEVRTKEGATAKLILDVQKLTAVTNSGGILDLTGSAANSDVEISSGGKVKAKELKTAQTTVKVSAGGEAAVFATDFVDAKTQAGGDITIYGNPKQVNQKKVAGGSITIIK